MTQSDGHVEQIAGAPPQAPQPVRPDPGVAAAWSQGPPADGGGEHGRAVAPPGTVSVSAILSLVAGVLLVVVVLSTLGSGSGWGAIGRLVFPAILVVGGIQALRGWRGLLTTGAVFLLVTGLVLLVQVLGSDGYDTVPASVEAAVRMVVGVLILVLSRVSSSADFFGVVTERRDGRREADFFR